MSNVKANTEKPKRDKYTWLVFSQPWGSLPDYEEKKFLAKLSKEVCKLASLHNVPEIKSVLVISLSQVSYHVTILQFFSRAKNANTSNFSYRYTVHN